MGDINFGNIAMNSNLIIKKYSACFQVYDIVHKFVYGNFEYKKWSSILRSKNLN